MPREVLQFQANIPREVILEYDHGRHVTSKFGTDQVMYSLLGGAVMYVPPIVEKQLAELGVRKGDPFGIVKREVIGRGRKQTRWEVERVDRKPAMPAASRNGKPQAAAQLVEGAAPLDSVYEPGADIPTVLEDALKTAIAAAKKAEAFGQSIGRPVHFDEDDIRSMANTLLINASRGGREGRAA